MKILSLALITLVISHTSAKADFTQVKTEDEFRNSIVEKVIASSSCDPLISHSDGTITGVCNGKKLTGSWKWSDGLWCRDIKLGDKKYKIDCQKYEIDGQTVRVTAKKGKGKKTIYKIK